MGFMMSSSLQSSRWLRARLGERKAVSIKLTRFKSETPMAPAVLFVEDCENQARFCAVHVFCHH